MRERANRNTAAQGRPLLTRGIHRTRSQDYAWYTCCSRCSCESIKILESAFCGGVAEEPSHRFSPLGDERSMTAAVRGSRRRVWFACPNTLDRRFACCAVGGAIFGDQFQSRIFVGTSADA